MEHRNADSHPLRTTQNDEYFVSAAAAKEGVTIANPSQCDPIVMLKHFGPNAHANMPQIS